MMKKKLILTGMQPSGTLHLGNVLGATNNWRTMLEEYECLFFLANQHAITIPYDPTALKQNSLNCVAQYIACGLDPEKCHIFMQSHIIGHTELMWILSCITPIGQLERMTQFKDKSKKVGESVCSGLLMYPTLMAADILLYNADLVPVGEDQKQHLELTRDLAIKFNSTYSETFTVPEPYIKKAGARVMSLQDPTSKMSKSSPHAHATIYVTDTDSMISKKIMSAVTDSGHEVYFDLENKPGVSNLLSIYSAVRSITIPEAEKEFASLTSYAPFKSAVAEAIVDLIRPIRERYLELCQDKTFLEKILADGAEIAQKKAYKMLSKVYRKVGFIERSHA